MQKSSKLFLETTIQIDRFSADTNKKEKINKQIAQSSQTLSSTYVKMEFKRRFIQDLVYLYNEALLGAKTFADVLARVRPNEKFSGKGHKIHVCKECSRMPKEKREIIEKEIEIYNYLKQSHISKKNIARLKILASTNNSRISGLAQIVFEIAEIKPYKKRRLKVLDRERRDLLYKLEETGLIDAHHYY